MAKNLTIRSSRARFAVSALALRLSQRRGRYAARLNSGVRPLQRKVLGTKHLRHRQLAAGQSGNVLRQLRSHSTRLKAQSSVTASPARLLRKRARIVHRIPGHRLRAGQSAGPPLWTWLVRKEPSSALHSAQGRGEQLAGSGLTIRSSRDRCAASAKSRRIVTLPRPRSGPA